MLIYTGCSTTAPNPDADALKPNMLDSFDYDLPASFYGCWEGTIDGPDSLTPLNWTGKQLRDEPITYQLCYSTVLKVAEIWCSPNSSWATAI